MKLLICFLLFTIPAIAQKTFIITNEHNAPISGASVFLVNDKNSLIAISDEQGKITVDLIDTAKYLIHSLGYVDEEFSADQLISKSEIVLKTASYQLKEVKVGSALFEFVIKQPEYIGYRTVIDIPQEANIQRVISIKIDSGEYLKSFKLFCKIQLKDLAPDYRFILFREKNAAPDSLLLPLKLDGIKSKKEINFDLLKSNFYLEKGTYFIGYETFNGKAIANKQIHLDKNKKKYITVPIVIRGSNEQKISYHRHNLSKWNIAKTGEIVNGKVIWQDDLSRNFAYELHLMH